MLDKTAMLGRLTVASHANVDEPLRTFAWEASLTVD